MEEELPGVLGELRWSPILRFGAQSRRESERKDQMGLHVRACGDLLRHLRVVYIVRTQDLLYVLDELFAQRCVLEDDIVALFAWLPAGPVVLCQRAVEVKQHLRPPKAHCDYGHTPRHRCRVHRCGSHRDASARQAIQAAE